MAAEVPVWVSGVQKWVTGVTRKTTCEDVVRALLKAEEARLQQQPGAVPDPLFTLSSTTSPSRRSTFMTANDVRDFAIIERWRKMERPLDGNSRILKAWNAWGDQKYEIKFSLKRVEPVAPTRPSASKSRHRPSSCRRPRHWRHHQGSLPLPEEHPKKFRSSAAGDENNKNIETLMKMILAQGETIRAQLTRIRERDEDLVMMSTSSPSKGSLNNNIPSTTKSKVAVVNNNNGEEAGSNDSGIVEDSGLIAKNKKLQRRASVASGTARQYEIVRVDVHERPKGSRRGSSADRHADEDDGFVDASTSTGNKMTSSLSRSMPRISDATASSTPSPASSPTVTNLHRYSHGSDPDLSSRGVQDEQERGENWRRVRQDPTSTRTVNRNHSYSQPHGLNRQLPSTASTPQGGRRLPTLPGETQPFQRPEEFSPQRRVQQYPPTTPQNFQHPSPAKNRAERIKNASKNNPKVQSGDKQQAISPASSTLDIDSCVQVYEKVLDLCLRLEREEERINKLTAKIQKEHSRQLSKSDTDVRGDEYDSSDDDLDEHERLLAESEAELRRMKRVNDDLTTEIERNDRTMADMSLVLQDKQVYLDELQFQLIQAEKDSDYLQDALDNFVLCTSSSSPASSSSSEGLRKPAENKQPKGILKNKHAVYNNQRLGPGMVAAGGPVASTGPSRGAKDGGPNRDADSDTGLSSLHSSSDEAQYALDTLV